MKNFRTIFILLFLISCNKTKDINSIEKTDSITKSQVIKERNISQKDSSEKGSKIIEDEEGNDEFISHNLFEKMEGQIHGKRR